jgi:hypothetical protein
MNANRSHLDSHSHRGGLEAAITPSTAAFLVELIQAEAGVLPPPPGFPTAGAVVRSALIFCVPWNSAGLGAMYGDLELNELKVGPQEALTRKRVRTVLVRNPSGLLFVL